MENRQRRPRHGSIESNPGQFESLNVTALGSYYPSMSTIAYNVPSVAYQVRDIQNRKLPDPPSPTLLSEVEQELYENTNLTYLTPTASTTSPDLIANVNMPRYFQIVYYLESCTSLQHTVLLMNLISSSNLTIFLPVCDFFFLGNFFGDLLYIFERV